jgi:hypothetical protein
MKRLIPLKGATPLFFIALALLYFAILPKAQAVIPPPDGGYPGFNTAEGQNALFNLTTGVGNAAVGSYSLFSNTDGSLNTAVGVATLVFNVGDQSTNHGVQNTAIGAGALLSNTTGTGNTANGALALFSNTTGGFNTANGINALFNNTLGIENTANGFEALFSNTDGDYNTANGAQALLINTSGGGNTATGYQALLSNMAGNGNTADGFQALYNNTASGNTAHGALALFGNTAGNFNTAVGANALLDDTMGSSNTAIGRNALVHATASGNIALGTQAGGDLTTGGNNIDIGNTGVAGESDTIRIGSLQTKTFIAGIRGMTTINPAIPVLIDTIGQLGTASSSRRFKNQIKPMDQASESIHALKPVTFHYKSDSTGTPQFGLIAEEVAEVNPDLVVRDEKGEIYTVRYDAVNAMLLNEFLKEHRKNEEQEATIAQQQKQIEVLAAGLQKMSAQMEMNTTASTLVRK